MNIKQKIITLVLGIIIASAAPAMSVAADCPGSPPPGAASCCGTTPSSIIGGQICSGADSKSSDTQANPIWKILIFALTIMTAGVGILGVGGIVYGSILYASASDKAEQTKKAIGIISNTVIGLVAYAFMYLLLNFLIPGGIFTK